MKKRLRPSARRICFVKGRLMCRSLPNPRRDSAMSKKRQIKQIERGPRNP